jgi:hypothetical protein
MPNWCHNRLTVSGNPEEVAQLVEAAHGPHQYYAHEEWEADDFDPKKHAEETPSAFSFQQLVPLPEGVLGKSYDPYGYEAEADTWGVKWGDSHAHLVRNEGSFVEYSFNTPWAPPEKFLIAVSKRFPGLIFALSYEEEMPTAGRMAMKAGETLDEEYFPVNEWCEEADKKARVPGDEETDPDQYCEEWNRIVSERLWNIHDDWCSELAEAHG